MARWLTGPLAAPLTFAVPFAAELAIGGYQLGRPSLWRDEGYTLAAASRPPAAILALAGRQDGVHGLYYLIMHYVVAVLGTSEVALRLPSLLAAGVAAGLTGLLGSRLARGTGSPASPGTGMLAGVLLAALPLTTWYAQDARPYALTAACAAGASWLLISAAGDGRWRWWAGYAAAITLLGMFNLYALLLLPAHGISLLLTRQQPGGRAARQRWLAAALVALVLLSPLVAVTVGQAGAFSWVSSPTVATVGTLLSDFAGSRYLVLVVAGLAALCIVAEYRDDRLASWGMSTVAVPWLVLPPAVLLAVSVIHPVYVERYVVFCLPAVALLTAAGLGWLARLTRQAWLTRRTRLAKPAPAWPGLVAALPSVLILAAMAALLAGPQLSVRQTAQRPDNLRGVAAILAAQERPGDAVIYLPWNARAASLAYPAPFSRLRDIGLGRSGEASGTLAGLAVPERVLAARLGTASRVWIVRWASAPGSFRGPRRERALLHATLRPIRTWAVGSVVLGLYAAGAH
jgi:mannosyltransferase